ncbi:MAG TPA: glycosyltransferase [Gemmatimonadales bacterium]|nr:glycosyltransferase [Gemmatimonadales bacterium]
MRVVMFYHSLVSDWENGNAHFLRGVAAELLARGHRVSILEPADGWSRANLIREQGESVLGRFARTYPTLISELYGPELDLDRILDPADLVLVHEWTDPAMVAAIGRHRAAGGRYRLLFHDTHHRAVTRPDEMADYDLSQFDGVLAAGEMVQQRYLDAGWARQAWTWHEAADHRVFRPLPNHRLEGDLVWVGNWGDEQRTAELEEFLIRPAEALKLRARVHGAGCPVEALVRLAEAGVDHGGWVPNFAVPGVFARFRFTVHIPHHPYAESLPGVPPIRVFEALACGIPLLCAPWEDREGLFTPGADYLVAQDGLEMRRTLRALMTNESAARSLAEHGRRTILARHTCVHRVNELLGIVAELNRGRRRPVVAHPGHAPALGSPSSISTN